MQGDINFKKQQGKTFRAYVLNPHIHKERIYRTAQERLEETIGLALALGLDIVLSKSTNLQAIKPKYLFGGGFVEEIKEQLSQEPADIVIVNHNLTPIQQRNLEKFWQVKVIDRTGLIIEIFAKRAHTREGQLQVELAALTYQRSRLVRSWTHLERQRGGASTVGGPGETQLEMDRRIIDDEIVKIKKQLAEVSRTRHIHRQSRAKVPYPIVALLGYTNAGKSTLFNQLTGADVFAENLLFATLDPTMRTIKLPSGQRVILSDTVGFISELPTQLIAAFKATLEEVIYADVLLIICDMASSEFKAQLKDVINVLLDLEIDVENDERVLFVGNKIDLIREHPELAPSDLDRYLAQNEVNISAVTGENIASLLKLIEQKVNRDFRLVHVKIPLYDGKTLAWLYDKTQVLERRDDDEFAHLSLKMGEKEIGHLKSLYKCKIIN